MIKNENRVRREGGGGEGKSNRYVQKKEKVLKKANDQTPFYCWSYTINFESCSTNSCADFLASKNKPSTSWISSSVIDSRPLICDMMLAGVKSCTAYLLNVYIHEYFLFMQHPSFPLPEWRIHTRLCNIIHCCLVHCQTLRLGSDVDNNLDLINGIWECSDDQQTIEKINRDTVWWNNVFGASISNVLAYTFTSSLITLPLTE